MRMVRFLFLLMIATALLPVTSLARQADYSSQQAPSQSGDRSESDYRRDVEVREENGQIRSREANQVSKRSASVTKTTKPAVSHPLRLNKTPATNSPRIDTPATVTGIKKTSIRTAVPVPTWAVGHRSLSTPSSAVSVNGQQFKSSRDLGAHLAISGGSLTAARGTAAINGTNMKRKP